LHIRLHVSDGHVDRVDIKTTRYDVSGALFQGSAPEDALKRMGQVFSLCGIAQTIAACTAAENALGVDAGTSLIKARDTLRLSEMATQTAMRLCLHWPQALNMSPLPAPVQASMKVQRLLSQMLSGALAGPAFAATDQDMSKLWQKVDALTNAIGDLRQAGGLHDQLRHQLVRLGWQGFGALPGNTAPEQGALSRCWNAPAVIAARQEFGAGLLARLEAGFCDLEQSLKDMRAALTKVEGVVVAPVWSGDDGTGQATVETARGALSHKVAIRQGKIASYQISAPTEANFAPGGPVVAGLLGAREEKIESAARLHVLAIDPCVDFTIGLDHA